MTRQTGKSVASKAGRILGDSSSTPAERSAAASALAQFKEQPDSSSAEAASSASEVLRDPDSSAAEKSVAGSTLSQRADRAH